MHAFVADVMALGLMKTTHCRVALSLANASGHLPVARLLPTFLPAGRGQFNGVDTVSLRRQLRSILILTVIIIKNCPTYFVFRYYDKFINYLGRIKSIVPIHNIEFIIGIRI